MEKPIFTIITAETNKTYKIYLSGKVEGFDEDVHISNKIPHFLAIEAATTKHALLLDMVKQQSEFIENHGWDADHFYSAKELKSISEGSSQDTKVYSLFNTVHKSNTA